MFSATALPARPPATAPTAAPIAVPTGPTTEPATAPAAMAAPMPAAPPAAAPTPVPTGCEPGAPVIGSGLASRLLVVSMTSRSLGLDLLLMAALRGWGRRLSARRGPPVGAALQRRGC